MIYQSKLNSSFSNSKGFNAKGCKSIYFISSEDVLSVTLNSDLKINGIDTNGVRFNHFNNIDDIKYTVKSDSSKSGVLYTVELTFSISKLNPLPSAYLRLMQNRKQVAIVEDNNGNYRLLGLNQGLMVSYDQSTEDSSYSVSLSNKLTEEPHFVAYSVIQAIETNDSTTPITTTPDNVVIPPTGGTGSSSSGNVMKVKNVTTNNYQAINSDHILTVANPYTILLPTSPLSGQEITIKAIYNASDEAPVIIRSNTVVIDGVSQVMINTEYGAVTMFYSNSKWYVRNYAI